MSLSLLLQLHISVNNKQSIGVSLEIRKVGDAAPGRQLSCAPCWPSGDFGGAVPGLNLPGGAFHEQRHHSHDEDSTFLQKAPSCNPCPQGVSRMKIEPWKPILL